MGAVKAKSGISGKVVAREENHSSGQRVDFEHILEMCLFAVAQVHGKHSCGEPHLQNLKKRGETEARLHELSPWHDSKLFTKREKAALDLSVSLAHGPSKKISEDVLREARQYLDREEMVRLTLAVVAISDSANLPSGSSTRVLVVEDNPHDQELLQRQLQKAQMADKVVFAPDAAQALDLLIGAGGEQFRHDLAAIFLDLHLPGMGGIDLLERIRIIPGMKDFPVIVMTSSNNPKDIEECNRLRVVSYVQKPITFTTFSHAVANILLGRGSVGTGNTR